MYRRALLLALIVALIGFSTTASLAQEESASGRIERIDKKGRITVDGQTVQITPATKLMSPDRRPLALEELTVGVFVEMSFVESHYGTEATLIIASVLR